MKKGMVSTIIISSISIINVGIFLFLLLPFDAQTFIESQRSEEETEFVVLVVMGLVAGSIVLMMYAWMLLIAVNVFLIVGTLGKILCNLNWDMILQIQ